MSKFSWEYGSVGRAAVSKTAGPGFKSWCSRQFLNQASSGLRDLERMGRLDQAPHFHILQPSESYIESIVALALSEDIGSGDVTTQAVVDPRTRANAKLVAKQPGVICGMSVAQTAFRQLGAGLLFSAQVNDGGLVSGSGEVLATIAGNASAILTAERVALNFLQRLSGVATLTARYVEAVGHAKARIVDTRKTTPGLRVLEKYAVTVGGGHNHRYGLSDGILIKDNHIVAAGGVTQAIQRARNNAHHLLKVEVEAKTLNQVEEAVSAQADVILLDNMDITMLEQAVEIVAGRALTEASGGVNLATVAGIASTGVDLISVGALTHSVSSLDISLDFQPI